MQKCPHCNAEINNFFEPDKSSFNFCDYCFWYKVVEEDEPPCIYCIHYGNTYPPESYNYTEQLKLYKAKFGHKIEK